MQLAPGFLGCPVYIVLALWDFIVSHPVLQIGQPYKSFKQINKLEKGKTVMNVRIIKT